MCIVSRLLQKRTFHFHASFLLTKLSLVRVAPLKRDQMIFIFIFRGILSFQINQLWGMIFESRIAFYIDWCFQGL
jgi:hypothetical protein